jgi:1-deoxy-D-xylulose-5-phosphate reductoisomerase
MATQESLTPSTQRTALLKLNNGEQKLRETPLAISVLGCTGSVGRSALELADNNPERIRIVGLAAHSNWELALEQAKKYQPLLLAFADENAAVAAKKAAPDAPFTILGGKEGILAVATLHEADAVLAAIVGFAGLESTLAALGAGKDVALANKEAIVCGASLVREQLKKSKAQLFPVDSEHSALYQCLQGESMSNLYRLWLTASGGPFRLHTASQLADITPEQALKHPTWTMGAKITIDSASLMNKGLELIEACELFGLREDQVEVVVHPESIVHSLVEYLDGSQIAQLSVPDMKGAIGHALSCCRSLSASLSTYAAKAVPERMKHCMQRLNLVEVGSLNFHKLNQALFPAVDLARQAITAGGSLPTTFNAANEIAVTAFLNKQLSFPAISHLVEGTLEAMQTRASATQVKNLEELCALDSEARRCACSLLDRIRIR